MGKRIFIVVEKLNELDIIAKVGLYYIMFLAALEMDMEGMKKNKSRLIIYGLPSFSCRINSLAMSIM